MEQIDYLGKDGDNEESDELKDEEIAAIYTYYVFLYLQGIYGFLL
jgi:hypothetical protein